MVANACVRKLDFNYTNFVLKNQLELRYKLRTTFDVLRFNVDSKCGRNRPRIGNNTKDASIVISVGGDYRWVNWLHIWEVEFVCFFLINCLYFGMVPWSDIERVGILHYPKFLVNYLFLFLIFILPEPLNLLFTIGNVTGSERHLLRKNSMRYTVVDTAWFNDPPFDPLMYLLQPIFLLSHSSRQLVVWR